MGVGVYHSNFDQAGSTFLVIPPALGVDEYESYLNGRIAEFPNLILFETEHNDWGWRIKAGATASGDAVSGGFDSRLDAFKHFAKTRDEYIPAFEEWSQGEYDDFNLRMIESIENAARNLRLDIAQRTSRFETKLTFSADRDFTPIIHDEAIEVGWRSWENMFVVGTTVGARFLEILSGMKRDAKDAQQILEEMQMPSCKAESLLTQLQYNAEEYVRLSLMEAGIECAFRTGGYTYSLYPHPANQVRIDQMAGLEEFIEEDTKFLKLDPEERMQKLNADERIRFAAEIKEIREKSGYPEDIHREASILVPVFDGACKKVTLWSPFSEDAQHLCRLNAAARAALDAHFEADADGKDELIALPLTPQTQVVFDAAQKEWDVRYGAGNALVMSAAEVAKAFKGDLALKMTDKYGAPSEQVVAQYQAPPGARRRF